MKIKGFIIFNDLNEMIVSVNVGDIPLSWIFPRQDVAEQVLLVAPLQDKEQLSVRQVEVEIFDKPEEIQTEITDIAKEENENGTEHDPSDNPIVDSTS